MASARDDLMDIGAFCSDVGTMSAGNTRVGAARDIASAAMSLVDFLDGQGIGKNCSDSPKKRAKADREARKALRALWDASRALYNSAYADCWE